MDGRDADAAQRVIQQREGSLKMSATPITSARRNAVREILEGSSSYDADTLRISRTGEVTAQHDANKTFAGNDSTRYLVGHIDQMVDAHGNILPDFS